MPLVGDVKSQMPDAMCDISPMNVAANMLMNPVPPFDDLEVRRAVAMTLDRKGFVDILTRARATSAAPCSRSRKARWGLPEAMLRELPGYDPDVAKSRDKARAIMTAKGYSAAKPLKLKLSTRNPPDLSRRLGDPDQPAQGDLHRRRTAADRDGAVVPKLIRRDYDIGAEPGRQRRRRPRPELSRELRLRLAHLHGLLQQGRSTRLIAAAVGRAPTRRSARRSPGRSTAS